ncbi:MAG: carbohydrate binding family 9 domain-containing protein [Gemmatimonadetes bacterium]|nr:carbohydrate binding family 9 domain-containing protein [Gemmatimonadota bacterium]
MHARAKAVAVALLMTSPARAALAQVQQLAASGGRIPVADVTLVRAVRAVPDAPRLDGRLDEATWRRAHLITGFLQREPKEGEAATEQTEAWVVYTDVALYIGVRAHDSRPDAIAAQLTRRDAHSPSDWIGVMIDSYRDRRTAFEFAVNPAGVKRDVYWFDDTNTDDSWDAVWDVAVSRDAEGWTAEFRIPFSQLRFGNAAEHRFGFNVYRKIARLNELQQWKLIPKNASGTVSQMGELSGLDGIRPPRRLEILPYSVGSTASSPAQAGNPFRTGVSRGGTAGGDVKVGIGSNLTLSATLNPDFGQVEADPAQVNLSAFESFFSERRPFFKEGADIFRFPMNLFYSRRIGRAPQGSADPRGGHAERINQTTILGATKLSGKTRGGWTIGLLGAQTARERAAVVDSMGAPFSDVIEPATTYLVGRLARDVRQGKTRFGFFGTAVRRHLTPNLQFLRRAGYAAGLDWSHRFRRDTYWVSGWVAATEVLGSAEAIDRTQRSSARYFQRPDNDYVTYDPTRTSLSGFGGNLGFGKSGGGVWRFSTGVDARSPGLEVNDAGFQGSVDWYGQWFWLNRRWQQPGKVFRFFGANFNQWSNWTYGWDRTSLGANINFNFTLLSYWGGYGGINRNGETLAREALRGGPAFIRPGAWNGWYGVYSDERKPLRFGLDGWWFSQAAKETHSAGLSPSVSWRPATNMDFSLSPEINWTSDDWQYLQATDVLGQREYFFGGLRQTTLSTTFRGNVTLRPTLTLQIYAQPFVSAGHYVDYKRVADPRAPRYEDRLEVLGEDRLLRGNGEVSVDLNRDGTPDVALGNPDFTVLSFRSNTVLRWEYRPGSTVFVVWQHGRSGFSRDGRFDFSRNFDDLFRSEPENTLLLKVNYWLSL